MSGRFCCLPFWYHFVSIGHSFCEVTMREQLPPMVCLDGTKVRTIREQQKLTQLYVAKVVGVTTDTISRITSYNVCYTKLLRVALSTRRVSTVRMLRVEFRASNTRGTREISQKAYRTFLWRLSRNMARLYQEA